MTRRLALLVIAQKGFQDHELAHIRSALENAGFEVRLASGAAGKCVGKFGVSELADVAVTEINVTDYDRLVFIGGPGAAMWKDNTEMKHLARTFASTNRPLGAICIAPMLLAAAGVLNGKRATVWDDGKGTQIAYLKAHGAKFTGEQVTCADNIVTGNGPKAAQEFGLIFGALA